MTNQVIDHVIDHMIDHMIDHVNYHVTYHVTVHVTNNVTNHVTYRVDKCEVAMSDGTFFRCIEETESWIQVPKMDDNGEESSIV